ncbi:hypothetical protein [Methanosarcina mazei]|uniref:Uncharacterized protein n=1 Tax=Methanosarcina mazei TaxID=2209 RepID=A0A6C0VII3_METMZ|nr:hypothetical protein [Methanosarcina mazei]QIB90978.1 hypothetical protein FQU78_07860 [Methanosarcina mazei]
MIFEKWAAVDYKIVDGEKKWFNDGTYYAECKCDICGKEFRKQLYRGLRTDVCSDQCAYVRDLKKQKEKRLQARITTCAVCGLGFVPSRSGAKYCSDRCRQAAYRQRKS